MSLESTLPGLSEWARVRDWRLWQLQQVQNAELYLGSALTVADILDYDVAHVVLATGADWRSDWRWGGPHRRPLDFLADRAVLTPDDVMDGALDASADFRPNRDLR